MRVHIRPWNLVPVRCVWLSVKMSAVVSGSVIQVSSFEDSLLSNVGISCSKDVVRLASLSVVCKVSLYTHRAVCPVSSLGWGVECGWSVIVRCCSLSENCVNSPCVCGWMSGRFSVSESVLKLPKLIL